VLWLNKLSTLFQFLLCSPLPFASPFCSHFINILYTRSKPGLELSGNTMAPALYDVQLTAPHELSGELVGQSPVDRKIFPDGIKTSGQHPPLYELLREYSDFPKGIIGKTVWKAEDYADHPERWVHALRQQEINELSIAADKFIANKIPLPGISKVSKFIIVMNLHLIFHRTTSACPRYQLY
jgi:hypothetical protein